MEAKLPDPRWQNFIEEFDSHGKKIGFKLEGNDHLFKYNEEGGWVDQHGKYYDCDGYLIQDDFEGNVDEDSDSEVDDDQIVDEFQQMLIEQEQGIIRKKPQKKQAPKPVVSEPKEIKETTEFKPEEQLQKFIKKLEQKEELRQGLSPQVWIFYKLKSNLYQKIIPEVEKKQDLNSRNEVIKQIKLKIEEKRKQLLEANKWLNGDFLLDHSGASSEEGAYERYWYGWVKVAGEKFFSTIDEINKSKEFTLLKSKTLDALKSKFFLKKKMKDTIKDLKQSLSQVKEENVVSVSINNLPEEFPISFIIDLIELTGGHLQDVEDIDIVDNFSATLICKKRTADKITNIQGYPHDQKEYIWIEVSDLKRPIKTSDFFNVQIDADYKVPTRETGDTLALQFGRAGIVKVYEKGEKFRLVVGQSAIKKVLMFRGETMNAVRIVRFEKIV